MLGRLIGSLATGGIVGLLAWLVVGSLAASILAGVVIVVDLDVGRELPQPVHGRGGRGRGRRLVRRQ